jgi:hypothetical protein
VRIFGQALAEGTDAQLHHGAVVQDLEAMGIYSEVTVIGKLFIYSTTLTVPTMC